MKISFSTLACPNYSWTDIYTMAKDLGFDGIEVRELSSENSRSPFSPDKCEETAQKLKSLKIEIPCLSTGSCLKFADKREENKKEIETYIDVAKKVGAPYIRVLADREPAPNGEVDDKMIEDEINELVPYAEKQGITMLIETNGVYSNTERLRDLLNNLKTDYVAALWDTHHTYRYGGESPEKTLQNLGAYIKYIHIKDSVVEDGKTVYKMMGEGDMPIDDIINSLKSLGS